MLLPWVWVVSFWHADDKYITVISPVVRFRQQLLNWYLVQYLDDWMQILQKHSTNLRPDTVTKSYLIVPTKIIADGAPRFSW
mgnify:CR=1 FL=1